MTITRNADASTRRASLVGALLQDARYGLRLLVRQPGFTALSVLTTAIGIGAATTLFSVTYGVLMRPFPWPTADRIVRISETREGTTRDLPPLATNALFLTWRDNASAVAQLIAFDDEQLTLTDGDSSAQITVVKSTAGLFDALGVRPALGGVFAASAEAPGQGLVVVLSHALWQSRFAGAADVVGRTIELDGEKHEVIGVMPPGFFFPTPEAQAWRPFAVPQVTGDDPAMRRVSLFESIALLAPGATASQAAAEGTARAHAAPELGMVAMAVFGTTNPARVDAVPYVDAVTREVRPALMALMAAVALLLATALANVAGMQLVRAAGRRREIALRASLGAGAGRLARQLLTENALLGLAGGSAGLLLAYWLHAAVPSLLPADFPRLDDVVFDWPVVGFAAAAAIVSALAFGLMPALTARRLSLVEVLNDDSQAPAGSGVRSRASRLRVAIMAGQVAVAVVLIIGASLLTRTLMALTSVDRGYDPTHLVTAELVLPDFRYDDARRSALVEGLLERLRQVPGVRAAAFSNVIPLMRREALMAFDMNGPRGRQQVSTAVRRVSPHYFESLGMRLVAGRDFTDADSDTSQSVAIVNRAFVRQYLEGDPLAVTLPLGRDEAHPGARIVGVVDDVRQRAATDPPQPELFRPYRQLGGIQTSLPLVVARTTGDPGSLVPTLRALVREQDAGAMLQSVSTMEERMTASLARPRLYAILLGTFAGLSLLVSGLGVFGVLSYAVAQRSREIGVRAALGATPGRIVALVVRQGLWATLVGVAVGLGVAAGAVVSVRSLLFGVSPFDPVSFGVAPAVLVLVAALACFAPARRAARIDPLKALKSN
jgi:putative ABC transport system permease protein